MSGGANRSAGDQALLRFLQRHGKITATEVSRLELLTAGSDLSLYETLEREGTITQKELATLLAHNLRLPLVDLASFPLDLEVSRLVKESVAIKCGVVPLRADGRMIEVATANPLDVDAQRTLEFATGRRARLVVATYSEVREALKHSYRLEESLDQFLQSVPVSDPLMITELKEDKTEVRRASRDADLPPIVRLVDSILIEGIKTGSSDIHLEPETDGLAVRYRIDGVLEERFTLPKWVQTPLTARIKILAKLDITERRVPQDGHIQMRYRDGLVDMRVSSLPAQHGEKITLRILDTNRGVKALNEIGLTDVDLQKVRDAGARPEGMILVTGPTGSGKTTTLYAIIREIWSPTVNIVTIENPVEYQLRGITQVEVNTKQNLTFASVLRSILRQDPDVILVGEIRDRETAQIAFQAAQTGHLVLSTVHTNDAVTTVPRLVDLGIEPYVVASSLNLVIAQRLIRKVCAICSAPDQPTEESLRLLRLGVQTELRRGVGCPECRQTGYRGRTGVYELLPISSTMSQLIEAGSPESALRQQSRVDKCPTLLEDALVKLLAGVTTPDEVLRVIQVGEGLPRCPNCQQEVDESFTICPHCSNVLRVVCIGCGKGMHPSWVTCPHCGIKAGASEAAPTALPPPAGAPTLASVPTLHAPAVRTFKALVVDDDPDLRRIVRTMLERSDLGLAVMTAQDGLEALTLAEIERPDIVILDVAMPGLDGFTVCRRLRADLNTAGVPVLMLTARDTPEEVTHGFREGADDYVVKPFRGEDLIARIRRMIQRTYGEPADDAAAVPGGHAPRSSSGTG